MPESENEKCILGEKYFEHCARMSRGGKDKRLWLCEGLRRRGLMVSPVNGDLWIFKTSLAAETKDIKKLREIGIEVTDRDENSNNQFGGRIVLKDDAVIDRKIERLFIQPGDQEMIGIPNEMGFSDFSERIFGADISATDLD